ncbi:MAG: aspartate aminotransferase family protein [Pseudomonadota bacterium]
MYPEDSVISKQLFDRARRVLPGGNSRHGVFLSPYPAYAAHASGCRVTDVDGVERIDCVNNWSSLIHGHGNRQIIDAIHAQANQVLAVGMPTESEIRLAELLVDRLPGVDLLHFSNSGSEGVLFAIRAARAFTGRGKVAKVEGAYHGNLDPMEVSVAPFGVDAGPAHAPRSLPATDGIPPGVLEDTVVLPFNDVQATEALLRQHGDDLAAVVIDPLVSRMGLIPATPAYLQRIREVTLELGILLIFDEVFSFRLGYHGAQGNTGVTPDLTALGKIIGGGLPVGATGGRADVMAVFDQTQPPLRVEHGGTYNANPMTMAAGLACMEQMTLAAYEHLAALGDRLRKGLTEGLEAAGLPGTVRGQGSLAAISFSAGEAQGFRDLQYGNRERKLMAELHLQLMNNGIQIVPYGMYILSTVMTEPDIDEIVSRTADALMTLRQSA